MEILPVIYGESVLPENMVFLNGRKGVVRDIVFKVYLVKTLNRKILIDAGCETMPGFVMKNFIGTVKALEQIGVSPKEITDVVITHAHHDHIECVKYFDKAVIHIESNEFENGKKYIPDGFQVNIFHNYFLVCKNIKIIKIGGHTVGSCIVELKEKSKTYIVGGDECYLKECLTKKIPTGNSYNKEKSKIFIQEYRKEEVLY